MDNIHIESWQSGGCIFCGEPYRDRLYGHRRCYPSSDYVGNEVFQRAVYAVETVVLTDKWSEESTGPDYVTDLGGESEAVELEVDDLETNELYVDLGDLVETTEIDDEAVDA